jgi:hypothetical protein
MKRRLLIAVAGAQEPAQMSGLLASMVVVVPEPSTIALAGLGAAALLMFRRRG